MGQNSGTRKRAPAKRPRVLYVALPDDLDSRLEAVRAGIVPVPTRNALGKALLAAALPSFEIRGVM